ncbi:carbonic anhydrase family protein [Chryseobacterium indoltheticum]|uniref:Carbonic anhydrase n=1 Tax=Chryseobacterium indoltheticum TaxID=254 RepID=A0A381FHR9_9FLAO|nr:carbonic anhydrase family protein [Chryseobacterium indoltheticum]SUX46071.1 Carbonic anhydrase [Chryseobacterium indoltheticum]
MKSIYYFFLIIFLLVSCKSNINKELISFKKEDIIDDYFLTEEYQSKLTPDIVLTILKERNIEYMEDNLTIRNTSKRIRKASVGQYPAAVVLSCLDSRVPVEDVFHSGIGDLFVARVAGNISNEDILGSLEYACKVSGAKAIIVLGHENCGAIKSAVEDVQLGNITALLSKIMPAVVKASENYNGEKISTNKKFLEEVTKTNIDLTIDNIRQNSPILKEMEAKGLIKIAGAEYHMENGNVEFLKG